LGRWFVTPESPIDEVSVVYSSPISKRALLSLTSLAVAACSFYLPSVPSSAQLPGMAPVMPPPVMRPIFRGEGSGQLDATTKSGKRVTCPLKHTTVTAKVAGHVSRVTVKQLFANPLNEKIEAVYTFPLSDTGAVDDMLMKVGERTIHGTIKKREEARQIYEAARASGHVAALLDQERPNIFTQSVANIEPNKEVAVTITYVDLLPYESGTYTFAFPTVVGPRFNPGTPTGKQGLGVSPDTTAVPDASKITPHLAPKGERAGHDISISVTVDSPVPVIGITMANRSERHVDVALANKATIPNKDFVLNWTVATDQVKSGYLAHGKKGEGHFNLSIIPPKRPRNDQIQPKEMVFLIDCSGSQSGAPLQKAKETMHYVLDHMNDDDTFQVITFNNSAEELFPQAQKATAEMRRRARNFIDGVQARGGTWMAPAVEKACSLPPDKNRLRIVTFMTDGYVGNDFQILGLIKKLRGTSRWFPFGTGNSVNRFLIDNIAKVGGGEAEYVYLNSTAAEVGKKFYDKISSPVLTDVKVSFGDLAVKEVFPKDVSDVWAEKPLYITGRYSKPGKGNVTITGNSGGKPYTQKLAVEFPADNTANDVLGSIWARAKVDRLMDEDWFGAQQGSVNKELQDEIIRTALAYHIMTQYTSFVAVEEQAKTKDGKLVTVEVPVEVPDGVERDKIYGDEGEPQSIVMQPGLSMAMPKAQSRSAVAGLGKGIGYYNARPHQHYVHSGAGAISAAPSGVSAQAYSPAPSVAGYGSALASANYYTRSGPITTGNGGGGGAAMRGSTGLIAAQPAAETVSIRARRKTNWYNEPRELKSEEKQEAAVDSLMKDAKFAKLTDDVRQWLNSNSSRSLKVRLVCDDAEAVKKALELKGVTLHKRTDERPDVVIVFVTREALRVLVAMAKVKTISKVD
jgi:Ca-activated chloride channel homolog